MDWNQVEGNWKQVRGNVKRHWGKLTDSDLTAIGGRREELEGKIQERYGYTKDRVRKEIEEWYDSLRFGIGSKPQRMDGPTRRNPRRSRETNLKRFPCRKHADRTRTGQSGRGRSTS